MKATAVAPANIAFIKYWGRIDAAKKLPANPSISMNLSACITTTTVEFSDKFASDEVTAGFDKQRIFDHIDRIRAIAGITQKAHVETKNSFPTSTGIASSASGFAALTLATASALGVSFSEKELTALSQLGSGSAARSIPDGFVKWEGEVARSLYPSGYWDLRDIVVIVGSTGKDVSSNAGHDTVRTSPYFQERLRALPERISRCERALQQKNFQELGQVIEEDCLDMHHVMQTQHPPLFYWTDETKTIMDEVKHWRDQGLPVYFTVDAGPNVHLICEAGNETSVMEKIGNTYQVIVNKPAKGAHLL